MRPKVYVYGAGGHAKVVISTLQSAGYTVSAALDDDPQKRDGRVLGVPVLSAALEVESLTGQLAVIGVGDNGVRKAIAERFKNNKWATVVHPKANVHRSVQLGPGTVVFAGAVIQPDTVVGKHSIVNTGATVDHDCVISDYVHVAPGVHLAGGVHLDEGVFLGVGSAVTPGTKIGRWTFVGAGGVVVNDLPRNIEALGVPAKPIRKRNVNE